MSDELDLRAWFERAVEAERPDDVLIEAKAVDPALAERIRCMLDSDGTVGSLRIGSLTDLQTPSNGNPGASPPIELNEKYRLLSRVCSGGTGAVFKAEQQVPNRIVAIKLLHPGIIDDRSVRRFEQEAHALGRLDHPGVATVYDFDTVDIGFGAQHCIVMEHIDGLPLQEHCARHQLSTSQRIELIAEVAKALHHVHLKGVIHRDVKPANIVVGHDGRPVLVDFGIARLHDPPSNHMTQAGGLLGTIGYMSPEQIDASIGEPDARSDVYALGVVLYELLSSTMPHEVEGSPREVIDAVLRGSPPLLGTIDRRLRTDIEHVVARAIEPDPAMRYQSSSEFGDDLLRVIHGEATIAQPASALTRWRSWARRRRRSIALSGAAVMVALALAVSFGMMYHRGRLLEQRDAHLDILSESVASALSISLRRHNPGPIVIGSADQPIGEWLDTMQLHPNDWARASISIGTYNQIAGDEDSAEDHFRSVISRMPEDSFYAFSARFSFAKMLHERGRTAEALAEAQSAYDAVAVAGVEPERRYGRYAAYLALLHLDRGDRARGAEYAAIALKADEDPVKSHWSLDQVLVRLGWFVEADRVISAKLDRARRLRLDHGPSFVGGLLNWSSLQYQRGDYAAAEQGFREAMERTSPRGNPIIGSFYLSAVQGVGVCLREQGRLEEAQEWLHRSVVLRREMYGDNHVMYANALLTYANVCLLSEQIPPDALECAREGLRIRLSFDTSESELAEAELAVAVLSLRSSVPGAALPHAREARRLYERALDADDWRPAFARVVESVCEGRSFVNPRESVLVRDALAITAGAKGDNSPWVSLLLHLCDPS